MNSARHWQPRPTRPPDRSGQSFLRGAIGSRPTRTLAGVILAALVARQAALAQPLVPPADELTQALISLNAQYQQSREAGKAQLLDRLLDVASTRQQLLEVLIADEPNEVLRAAIPDAVRATLPPSVQAYIEGAVETEGELEVIVEDRLTGSTVHYRLNRDTDGPLSLYFAADAPTDLLTGSRVRVRGVQVDGALALTSGSTSVQMVALASPNTFGAQKTLVILVNFQDKATQPYTVATARGTVFNTTSNFDFENSFQQTWLTGDVYGWYTLPLSSTVCDSSSIATYAKQAASAAGVNLSAYTHYLYAFPQNACTWWGLGSVGGTPSNAWINGSLALMVVGHEMGHNFGLYHSHGLDCGDTSIGTSCSATEYGDSLDIMGQSRPMHFNAFQKERLGWLNYEVLPAITTVQAGGTYALEPYESQTSGPKALKILKSTDPTTGRKTWYYVELRQATGFDSTIAGYTNVLNGVVVHAGSESSGNTSYLLDMTPADAFSTNPALDVGQSFYDPTIAMTITPVSVSSSGAAVNVAFGPLPCVRSNPSLGLAPSQSQWVPPGSTVSYTVLVTNNDNSGCAASSFQLQAAVPTGWGATFAAPTLSIAPGGSASTILQISSPSTAPDAFYNVAVSATNSAYSTSNGSTTATVVLVSSLTVSVSTDRVSYTRNQTISMMATVTANGSAIASAPLAFTVTKANGTTVVLNATTDPNGAALAKLRLKKQDPTGKYQVRADATMSSAVSGSASADFLVQ
jgi:M6 family metalloprotease-like protein